MIYQSVDKCCGCTLCQHICPKNAIELKPGEKGFLYPFVNKDLCINCNLCEQHCPLMVEKKRLPREQLFYAVKRNDDFLRKKSQSGGAFSVFAESILRKKGTVYGVASTKHLNIQYTKISSNRQLESLRKSKYCQASVGDVFKEVRKDLGCNKYVLFSGTPCHINGLLNYLKVFKIDMSRLFTIDIVCHGVASPLVYRDYLSFLKHKYKKKIIKFVFRDKRFGWYRYISTYRVGHREFKSSDYAKIFQSDLALRDCCYSCQYSNLNRVGDITIGDCWGLDAIDKLFTDKLGCSLIIVNNEKGETLFNNNINYFNFMEIKNNKPILQQNLVCHTMKPELTNNYWNDYTKYGFKYTSYKYCNINPDADEEMINKYNIIKRVIRKIRRALNF